MIYNYKTVVSILSESEIILYLWAQKKIEKVSYDFLGI